MTEVANLVREECCKTMLHDAMTLARHMVYGQSIEDTKLCRISRNLKRIGLSDQSKPRFKKRAQTQD